MRMKQPDRFEKIVMVEQAKHHRALFCVEIIGLLRRQHQAYVRMVKRVLNEEMYDTTNKRRLAAALLAALERRGKR